MAKRGRKKGSRNSASHRKAISAGLRRYWRGRKGSSRRKSCRKRGCPTRGRKRRKRKTTTRRRRA